jgi:hypothetical protein
MSEEQAASRSLLFEEAIAAATALIPCRSRFGRAKRSQDVDNSVRAMAERLLRGSEHRVEWPRYCSDVLWFAETLRKLRSGTLDTAEVRKCLVDIADLCFQLPADQEVVAVLKRLFHEGERPIPVLAAECIARLKGGLPHAQEMLSQLLASNDEKTRARTLSAIRRAAEEKSQLMEGISEQLEMLHYDQQVTSQSLIGLRETFGRTAIALDARADESVSDVLTPIQILVDEQLRDQGFFRQKRDEFLTTHAGQFTAIRDGKVLGFAGDLADIHRLVREALGPDARVFISQVLPEAFEEECEIFIYMD